MSIGISIGLKLFNNRTDGPSKVLELLRFWQINLNINKHNHTWLVKLKANNNLIRVSESITLNRSIPIRPMTTKCILWIGSSSLIIVSSLR